MNDYKTNYKIWLQANIEDYLKQELLSYSEKQIVESFTGEIEFGTGGLRGVRGPGTSKMNIYNVKKVTLGYANYLKKTFKNQTISVVASYDNRHYSYEFALRSCKVLQQQGIKTYIFKQLTPTPILSYAVRHLKCNGGIMLTASHNPKEYNGYKIYNSLGAQLTLSESEECVKEIQKISNIFDISESLDDIEIVSDSVIRSYLKKVKKIVINNQKSIKKNIKIVYSPLHGTGGTIIPTFLQSCGYCVFPLDSQMTVDPNFSNTLSSNPEDANSFIEAIKYGKEISADLILLTDPDADRLGFAYKNYNDEYILVDGNQTASIMLFYKLSENAKRNRYFKNGVVFTTNVTTKLLEDIAISYKTKVVTCLTGFKNIAEGIANLNSNETFVFGAEESYGSICDSFVRDKDSVQACLFLCEIVSNLKKNKMLICDYLEQIHSCYGYYAEYTHNYIKPGLDGKEVIAKIMSDVRQNGLTLDDISAKLIGYDDCTLNTHCDLETNTISPLNLEWSNVMKYYYDNGLFIVLRPSGTEPKLKVYFSYPSRISMADAKSYVNKCYIVIDKLISSY